MHHTPKPYDRQSVSDANQNRQDLLARGETVRQYTIASLYSQYQIWWVHLYDAHMGPPRVPYNYRVFTMYAHAAHVLINFDTEWAGGLMV